MKKNRRIGDVDRRVLVTRRGTHADQNIDQRVVSQPRRRFARFLRRIFPDAQQLVNRKGRDERVVFSVVDRPLLSAHGNARHRRRRVNLPANALRERVHQRFVSAFDRIVVVQLMQIPLGRDSDRRLQHVFHRRLRNARHELQPELRRVVVPDLAVVRDEVFVGDAFAESLVRPLGEIRRRLVRVRIDDVSVNAVEVVFLRQRGQIVLERILDQPALEPDLVFAPALLHVLAKRLDHQREDVFVLAEHDVRTGGVERETLLDDRSAKAADTRPLFQDLDVFAELRRETDPRYSSAEDAEGHALS